MSSVLIPNPLNTDMEYARLYHLDLPYLDDTQLVDEFNYIRAHLWQLPPGHWLRERVRMLESELKRRKVGVKNAIY